MKHSVLLLLSILPFLTGCYSDPYDEPIEIMGYAPIYLNLESGDIVSEAPRAFENLSSFVIYNDLIFIVEHGKGVHIVNNSNPSNPTDISFIAIPGTISLAVKDDFAIIVTSYRLISVDITDLTAITVSSVTFSASVEGISLLPPDDLSNFECVESSKGILAGWEKKLLINPKCWR